MYPTTSDTALHEWTIDDEVLRFRHWASAVLHPFPPPPIDECTIGAADTCAFQIIDPTQRVSRLHARLVREHTRWLLRDLASKNGVYVDGMRLQKELVLAPGLEIRIGGVTLIAESARFIALGNFLARLLGWESDRLEVVDHALRAVRMAAMGRAVLVLCGDCDLAPIARSIHCRVRGFDRPFIVCDPRRRSGEATVRSAENRRTGMEAFAAATGGSVCLRRARLPRDFPDLIEALREPRSQIQLIVCADSPEDCDLCRVRPVVIPPLAGRQADLGRIIHEYAIDAIAELEAPPPGFLPEDDAWVRKHAAKSLPDIEKATLRLVALRASPNISQAAARLGMAPVSLARWIGRRRMPMKIEK